MSANTFIYKWDNMSQYINSTTKVKKHMKYKYTFNGVLKSNFHIAYFTKIVLPTIIWGMFFELITSM